jgi:hypothetical protein
MGHGHERFDADLGVRAGDDHSSERTRRRSYRCRANLMDA